MSTSMIVAFVTVFILSALGTMVLDIVFRFLGKRGYLGNLYPNVRGGIPRAVGIIPFVILIFYILPEFNTLVLIIGIFALIDDILGRKKIEALGIEWGQLSRGIGILAVMVAGATMGLGISSIFIALLVQPLNIADMQPGSACMVTMIMSIITIICMLIVGTPDMNGIPAFYTPLLLFLVCLAYSPLDFAGKIMLGEVGNHTFAVALGICFYLVGGFLWVILLSIITVCLTAFVRRSTLKVFFRRQLGILNPNFGDYIMDVLTGGGLGDLIRRMAFKNVQPTVKNEILISLGFRRLLFNPYANHHNIMDNNRGSTKVKLEKH